MPATPGGRAHGAPAAYCSSFRVGVRRASILAAEPSLAGTSAASADVVDSDPATPRHHPRVYRERRRFPGDAVEATRLPSLRPRRATSGSAAGTCSGTRRRGRETRRRPGPPRPRRQGRSRGSPGPPANSPRRRRRPRPSGRDDPLVELRAVVEVPQARPLRLREREVLPRGGVREPRRVRRRRHAGRVREVVLSPVRRERWRVRRLDRRLSRPRPRRYRRRFTRLRSIAPTCPRAARSTRRSR